MKSLIPIFISVNIFIHSLLSWEQLIVLRKIREIESLINSIMLKF